MFCTHNFYNMDIRLRDSKLNQFFIDKKLFQWSLFAFIHTNKYIPNCRKEWFIIFFHLYLCENQTLFWPHPQLGIMIWTILNEHFLVIFINKFDFFNVLSNNIVFHCSHGDQNPTPIIAPSYLRWQWLKETWIYFTRGCFQPCFSISEWIVFEKKIFKVNWKELSFH